ncbi:Apc15p-like protein [Elsinoe australis]|uniref:Apc15p-like protein n=1 Tax=Elsinoe australis TaxID=40998 RepID=A0A4U7BBS0_9PEZI|nr:Apc15p-like protein [Elsinoe australis]
MFSLPLITPIHDFSLYLPHSQPTHAPDTHDTSNPSDPIAAAAAQQAQQQRRQNPPTNPFSPLAVLKADEDAIRKRKENIARFGSTWIKPPGVLKTLQAETEERAEREEQEMLARREQMMLDMQAQQEREEMRARREAGEMEEDEEEGVDLDDEVPDADEGDVSSEEEDDEDEESDEGMDDEEQDLDADVPDGRGMGMERDLDMSVPEGIESTEGDVTFNDGSLIEGSMFVDSRAGEDAENEEVAREIAEQERYARIEEAELTGAAQEEYDLGMEGNLDDSVPEAGAYEHTDTELEDDSSEEEESFMAPPARTEPQRRTSGRTGLFDISRRALGGRPSGGSTGSRSSLSNRDASSLLESSFVTSSPVMGRLRSGQGRGRGR